MMMTCVVTYSLYMTMTCVVIYSLYMTVTSVWAHMKATSDVTHLWATVTVTVMYSLCTLAASFVTQSLHNGSICCDTFCMTAASSSVYMMTTTPDLYLFIPI